MYIIIGLGNPTAQYEGTRHNVGFDVIDRLGEKYNIAVDTKKHKAYIGTGMIDGQKVILVKTADLYESEWRECEGTCRLLQSGCRRGSSCDLR